MDDRELRKQGYIRIDQFCRAMDIWAQECQRELESDYDLRRSVHVSPAFVEIQGPRRIPVATTRASFGEHPITRFRIAWLSPMLGMVGQDAKLRPPSRERISAASLVSQTAPELPQALARKMWEPAEALTDVLMDFALGPPT